MSLFTQYERDILSRFKDERRVITEEEYRVLTKWSSIGFVNCSYDWELEYPTAKLRRICKDHLHL